MKTRPVGFFAVVVLAAGLTACSEANNDTSGPASQEPAQTGSGSVWVANEGADSLAVLDTATNAVSATVTGLKKPHNVQVGRDGGTVYAVSSTTNTVVAIDAAAYTVKAVASTGSGPAHVIEAPNGRVYVTDANDGTVSVYQGPELRPDGRIDLGGMPHGLRAAAGGSVIVVANTMAGALNVIDPATDRLSGTVAVGTGPAQVAVTANGRYAYAGITDPPSVVKVDVGARNVVGSVRVSASPVQLYLTPDESTVLSADQGSPENPGHTLSVMDTSTMTVRGAVGTGAGPHGVVVDNSGMRAWVTNAYDDTVSIVDIGSLSLVATVAVGAGPSGISYSSRPPATSSSATVTLDVPQPAGGQPTNEHEH